jgi:GH3 auxin-responsive promoter
LETIAGIHTGRLSGISNHHVPSYLRTNQLPSYSTNCMDDWEAKVNKIADETIHQNMTLISGIPPWVQMYFDVLSERTGKKISELFPNFKLFIYGGVNFEPYRKKLEDSMGRKVDSIELFPASEGFFAYQDQLENNGLLLLCNEGIFYEFIPLEEIGKENPNRLMLEEVELDKNYALIINSNAGLWGYNIGDTVKFVSKNPYRIKVSGRVKHYISAFGEHVIGEEVDFAIQEGMKGMEAQLIEFHVAPQVNPEAGLPYHEWFIELNTSNSFDISIFSKKIDEALQAKNIYYKDLRVGGLLQEAKIRLVKPQSFIHYMQSEGKLGGQNKVPRLSNDRKIADWMHQNSAF